jgi:hypothetical protein
LKCCGQHDFQARGKFKTEGRWAGLRHRPVGVTYGGRYDLFINEYGQVAGDTIITTMVLMIYKKLEMEISAFDRRYGADTRIVGIGQQDGSTHCAACR